MFAAGEKVEHDVTGTVKAGKVSWLGKDSRVVRGKSDAADNVGVIGRDKEGDRIDFAWRREGEPSGTYTSRPREGK